MADEFDDIDFGDDFDIDEMSLGDEQLSDRTPIQNVTKRFGKAAYDASIGSSSVREKLVEKALPQPFTSGYRTAGDIKGEIDKSLDHLSRELRETKQDAKTAARAILPMLKGYLPNSIRKKAENWAKADVSYGGSDVDPQTAEIAAALDGIFGAPTSAGDIQKEQLEVVEQEIGKQEDRIKRDGMLGHLINIDDGVQTVVAAQASTVNYRRKMLELQYRSFFTLKDTLSAHAEAYGKIIPTLEAISKNTALPDYAKEEFGEITSALMKRNIIEKLSPLNWSRNYYKYVGEAFRGKVSEMAGNARQAMSMMSMMSMGNEYDDGESADLTNEQLKANYANQAATVAGGVAGDILSDKLISPVAKKIQGFLLKNPEIMKALSTGTSVLDNQAAFVQGIDTYDSETNVVLKGLRKFVDWVGPRDPSDMDAIDTATETASTLNAAGKLTRRSIKAIDHIIPSLLAKIDQSVRRIYNPKAALEMYDYEQDKFVTVASWQKRALASAQDDSVSRSLTNSLEGFLGDIRRGNSASAEGIDAINDPARDVIKKAIEIATRNHCFIFDPRQQYAENGTPLGLDLRLINALSEEEVSLLVSAFNDIFAAATTGLSDQVREGHIHMLKNQFNKRAQAHYGAQRGTAANRTNELISIYGLGRVAETDLVWATKNKYTRRPDYYLGKKLVIKSDWFDKGVYSTTAGPLYTLRGVSTAIFGPHPDGKESGRATQLVSPEQLPYLRTQEGEHFEAVENTLNFSDSVSYRLNRTLNGTSQLNEKYTDEVLGSEMAPSYDSAEYTDDGDLERNLAGNREDIKRRRSARQEARDARKELEALREGRSINIGQLNAQMGGVETRLDKIIDQLVHNNVHLKLDEIRKTIEEHSMIVLNETVLDPKLKERLEKTKSALGRAKDRVAGAGSSSWKWVKEQFQSKREWLREKDISLNPFKAVGGAISTAYNSAVEFGKGILGKRDIIDDLGNVVISALDIQSKRLYTLDKDNNYVPITKLSDIKGGVYRLAEDGTTYNQVFSPDEIAAKFDKLRYHTKNGFQKVVIDGAGWMGERLRSLHKRGAAIVSSGTGMISGVAKAAWGALAFIPDIYYSVDPEPRTARLLARVAKEGGYIDVKTGKPIKYFSDIHGEVRDLDGNTRISQDDFENPEGRFIDVDGNDVTSLMSSVASTARRLRQRTLAAGQSLFGWFRNAAEASKELMGKMLGFVGGMFNKGGIVLGQRLVVERLEQIYILLNDRLAGSGQGGPLPFEPMQSGRSKRKDETPEVDGEGNVVNKPKSMSEAFNDIITKGGVKEKSEAVKAQAQAFRARTTKKLVNYTAKFKAELIRKHNIDPDEIYSNLMSDLNTTREKILSETGIDQAMLDLALLDAEFKNIYAQYQRGELSKEDYKAKIREMSDASPYKDVYHKTMGVLGAAAKKAQAKVTDYANEKVDAVKQRMANSDNKYVKQLAELSGKTSADIKRTVTSVFSKGWKGLLSSKEEKALLAAIEEHKRIPFSERGEEWYTVLRELSERLDASRKAELEKKDKSKDGTGPGIGDRVKGLTGKFFEWRRSKQQVDPKVANATDVNSDGVRDGSFAEKAKAKAEEIAQKGFFKNMASAFGSVFGVTKGKKKEGGGIMGALMSALLPMVGGLVKQIFVGPVGILTLMKSMGQMLLGGGKFLGGMALEGAKVLGGAAMRYAITPALGMAGSALGASAGAIAGLAVNPVAWGVAAAALAGWGLYKTYKWASADRIPMIDQLRVATYGAEDYSRMDLSDVPKTLFLEDAVAEYASFDADGRATINKIPGQAVFEMIQGWGIDPKDQEQVQLFMNWFQGRFLPVYSVWLTAAKQYLNITGLKEIGNDKKFSVVSKVRLAKATRMAKTSPIWSVVLGPYNDEDNIEFDEVDELFADAIEEWAEKEPSARTEADTYRPTGQAYGLKAPPGSLTEKKPDGPEFVLKDRKQWLSFGDGAGNSDELDGREVFSSKVTSVQGYRPKSDGFRHVKDAVDALTAVRLRLYGCWDLTTQNVNNAYALEDLVYPDLKPNGENLEYTGDLKALYQQLKGMGGFTANYDFEDFKHWFARLFLPVLSAYIGAVNKHLKAEHPFDIKVNGGDKGFLIAKAMWAVPQSVRLAKSPFKNEEIDDLDLATEYLEASMASLEKLYKAHKVKEESTSKKNQPVGGVTEKQAKVLQSTGGKFTLDKDGKLVRTAKGSEGIVPWKPGATANNGPGGDASVWGGVSDADAMAGGGGPVKPPRPSPKRSEAERLLIAEAVKAGITDPTEIAMLLAQAAHESGGFSSVEENLNYSSERLLQIFPKYFSPAMAKKYGRNPVAIANIAYGKRMGNKDPGDGYKYRGRGFMQLTGRSNYEALAKKYPQARDPDWVSTPEGSAASAVYFWTNIASQAIRQRAQRGDVLGATKIVNGGTNGLADRRNEFGHYMQKIKAGELDINPSDAQSGTTEGEGPATASAAKGESTAEAASNAAEVAAAAPAAPARSELDEMQKPSADAQANAAVPEREKGTPENVAAKANARQAPPPPPVATPAPAPAPRAAPVDTDTVSKEQASTRRKAEEASLLVPVNRLVEVAMEQLSVQKAILQALGSGKGSGPVAAPISMKRN